MVTTAFFRWNFDGLCIVAAIAIAPMQSSMLRAAPIRRFLP